jgi:epoxyqueuosine reductase
MTQRDPRDHRTLPLSGLRQLNLEIFAVADLEGITTPPDVNGGHFPPVISFAVLINPVIMAGFRSGPNRGYAEEYNRVNDLIDRITASIETFIRDTGFRALGIITASARTDQVGIKGDFPHTTAATRAGLGWIGRNCLLITKRHGP